MFIVAAPLIVMFGDWISMLIGVMVIVEAPHVKRNVLWSIYSYALPRINI